MHIFAPLLLAGAACSTAPAPVPPTYEELFRTGVEFGAFLDAAEARRELWLKNWERSAVPEDLAERARALGEWNLLAVTVDRCSDSVSTIPYLARLAETAPNLRLRLIDPEAGKAIMESHRTPDDRAATPTVLLLDTSYEERGCFVERPSELQTWWLANGEMPMNERVDRKMQWYDEDVGQSTIREVIELLEAARDGRSACAAGTGER